jgi:membrane protease YdiL (CAAX protease family)
MNSRAQSPLSHVWQLAIALAVVFAAMRVGGVLGPRGLRWLLPAGFTLMALAPFLLLDVEGRRAAGLTWHARPRWWLIAILAGSAASLACFALGYALFGDGGDNWFITIANNYRRTMDTTGWPLVRLHLVFTIPALIFSPIGEEIFFRGYLQYALERRFSVQASTIAECAAFGLVHLCHHGLLLTAAGFSLRPVSGPLWVVLMFFTALLFAYLRKRSGSLVPAIVAHVCFNLVMNLTIFGFLWQRLGP